MVIVVHVEMAGKDTANPESRLVDIVGLHPTNFIANPGAILERRVGQSCNSTQLSNNTSHTLPRGYASKFQRISALLDSRLRTFGRRFKKS